MDKIRITVKQTPNHFCSNKETIINNTKKLDYIIAVSRELKLRLHQCLPNPFEISLKQNHVYFFNLPSIIESAMIGDLHPQQDRKYHMVSENEISCEKCW